MDNAPPGKVAVIAGTNEITYSELEQKSSTLAVHIWQTLSKSNSNICGLTMDKSIEMLLGILGILKAGGGYLALPATFPDERLQFLADDSSAALVVCGAAFREKVQSFAKQLPAIVIEEASLALPSRSNQSAFLKYRSMLLPTDTFGVIYTSGSTGHPKGVELTHQAVSTAILQEIPQDVLKQNCRVLQNFSMQFDPHISEIFGAFASHATLVLGPKDPTDMATLHEIVQSAKVDCCMFVPSIFNVYAATYGVPQMKFIAFGGEAMPIKLWTELAADSKTPHVENHYGPTESSVVTTIFGPDPKLDLVDKAGSVPIGRALRWRECLVADPDTGKVLHGHGHSGELLIGGPGLAKGYVKRPDTTQEKFIQHPLRSDERMYKSGDMVQFMETGDILFQGRADTQVKLHGLRIELGEIESVLRSVDGVVEAQVVKHDNDTLVAFLQPMTADTAVAAAVCKGQLTPYMVPSTFVKLAEFPRVASGSKIDRKALASWELPEGSGGNDEDGEDVVQVSQDSMLRMRLVSKEDVYVKTLLGFAALLFCISHWKQQARMRVPAIVEASGEFLHVWRLIRQMDSSIFCTCIAYTEATTLGADGRSEAFRFTNREIYIGIMWLALLWPIPQVLWGVVYIVTGQPMFDTTKDLGGNDFFYHVGFHWFLLFLLFAKATIVLLNRLDLSPPSQVFVVGFVHSLVTMLYWNWWPAPPYCGATGIEVTEGMKFEYDNRCVYGQELHAYFTFTLVYISVLHYGRPFLHWCRDVRNAAVDPSLRFVVSVALGIFGVIGFFCMVQYAHDAYWGGNLSFYWHVRRCLEPVHIACASFFALLFVPNLSVFSFIGRHALCVYVIHDYFGDFWLDGANIRGLTLFPRFETALSAIYNVFPNMGSATQGWITFAVTAFYAFVFVLTMPWLLQNLVILAYEGFVKSYSFAREKMIILAQQKKETEQKKEKTSS
jgi:amino acid adenylation domain-containing protein